MEMDWLDTEILNRIQGDLPVSEDPYGDIGKAIGVEGAEVHGRVLWLLDRGVIRKVGPFFDAKKMGYRSTLCAVDVPPERLADAVAAINCYAEVTHNYLREGAPNLWFTVVAESDAAIGEIISDISKTASIGPIHNLPAKKTFKVKVDLKVGG